MSPCGWITGHTGGWITDPHTVVHCEVPQYISIYKGINGINGKISAISKLKELRNFSCLILQTIKKIFLHFPLHLPTPITSFRSIYKHDHVVRTHFGLFSFIAVTLSTLAYIGKANSWIHSKETKR